MENTIWPNVTSQSNYNYNLQCISIFLLPTMQRSKAQKPTIKTKNKLWTSKTSENSKKCWRIIRVWCIFSTFSRWMASTWEEQYPVFQCNVRPTSWGFPWPIWACWGQPPWSCTSVKHDIFNLKWQTTSWICVIGSRGLICQSWLVTKFGLVQNKHLSNAQQYDVQGINTPCGIHCEALTDLNYWKIK